MKTVTWGPPRAYSPEPFPESEEEGSLGLDELDESEELEYVDPLAVRLRVHHSF